MKGAQMTRSFKAKRVKVKEPESDSWGSSSEEESISEDEIVFDECHKAMNLCPTESGKSTKIGTYVLELQKHLLGARVVYASATGATEPSNMAYMERLGLWGPKTAFSTFLHFRTAIENRGVGAMEMVAMEMKLRGMYIARQLSFQNVSFNIEEVPMTTDFKKMYDESSALWMEAKYSFQWADDHTTINQNKMRNIMTQFWSEHECFFKYLCIASKVDACVRLTKKALEENKCVVICLQSTGEAHTQKMVDEKGGVLTEFVSTVKNDKCQTKALGPSCDVGQRTRQYIVLSGSILSVWIVVDDLFFNKMQIIRLKTVDGEKIVGIRIPNNCVGYVESSLKLRSSKVLGKELQ